MSGPKRPQSESYMRGWFLVKFNGDAKRARREARRYINGERVKA